MLWSFVQDAGSALQLEANDMNEGRAAGGIQTAAVGGIKSPHGACTDHLLLEPHLMLFSSSATEKTCSKIILEENSNPKP